MSVFEPKEVVLKDGRTVTLRTPEVDEAADLIAYLDGVRRTCDGILFSPEDELPTLEFERGWIERNRENPGACFISGWHDGRLIALCSLQQGGKARVKHTANLGISVAAGYRGQGLGEILMRELIGFAREHAEIELVTLGVLADNPVAMRLYAKMGFEDHGRTPRFIKKNGRYVDHVNMGLWLAGPC